MGEIYSAAKRVVVWLGVGKEDDDVATAIELMSSIHSACAKYGQVRGYDMLKYTHEFRAFAEVEEDQLDQHLVGADRAWKAIRHFFSRQWFSRVWCVQEIMLAKASIVCIGQHSLPWEVIGVAACWLNTKDMDADFDLPRERAGIRHFNALCMFDKDRIVADPFAQTLLLFRGFRATDARDKVYGMLGIADRQLDPLLREMVVVDYSRKVWEVYA